MIHKVEKMQTAYTTRQHPIHQHTPSTNTHTRTCFCKRPSCTKSKLARGRRCSLLSSLLPMLGSKKLCVRERERMVVDMVAVGVWIGGCCCVLHINTLGWNGIHAHIGMSRHVHMWTTCIQCFHTTCTFEQQHASLITLNPQGPHTPPFTYSAVNEGPASSLGPAPRSPTTLALLRSACWFTCGVPGHVHTRAPCILHVHPPAYLERCALLWFALHQVAMLINFSTLVVQQQWLDGGALGGSTRCSSCRGC